MSRVACGLFVPNDGDWGRWLTWARGGNMRKVAVELHSAVNCPQLLAAAIERGNVPTCVRSENCSSAHHAASAAREPLSRTPLGLRSLRC